MSNYNKFNQQVEDFIGYLLIALFIFAIIISI
jgi:hypothetical protein